MLNFAILTLTVIVLLVSLISLGRILSAGSVENVIERSEDNLETDDYVTEDYLKEYLDDYEISVEDFQETHKQIILL